MAYRLMHLNQPALVLLIMIMLQALSPYLLQIGCCNGEALLIHAV